MQSFSFTVPILPQGAEDFISANVDFTIDCGEVEVDSVTDANTGAAIDPDTANLDYSELATLARDEREARRADSIRESY